MRILAPPRPPLVAAGVVAVAVLALGLGGDDDRPGQEAIDRYLAAWERGDDAAAAAALTDQPGRRAAKALPGQPRRPRRRVRSRARVARRRDADGENAARVPVTWTCRASARSPTRCV